MADFPSQVPTDPTADDLDEAPVDMIANAVEQNDRNQLLQILKKRENQPLPLVADGRKWTALHVAASKPECKEFLELLFEYDNVSIVVNKNNQTNRGETALHIACDLGCEENVIILLKNGCDAEKKTCKGYSALHIAAAKGYMKIVQYLLDYSVNIDSIDAYLLTPLHLSAEAGHLNVCELLLKNGANIRSVDIDDHLPLHLACQYGTLETAAFLLDQDLASINVKNSIGMSPFMLAISNFDVDGVEYLLEKGARTDIYDNCGRTAVHFAAYVKNVHLFSRLILSTNVNFAKQWCVSTVQNQLSKTITNTLRWNSLNSYTCSAIQMGPEFLKVLMNSHLPRSVLQMPSCRSSLSLPGKLEVLSPLAYLFLRFQRDNIMEFNQCLELLFKYNIIMTDEFQRALCSNWPNHFQFVNPLFVLVSDFWPNDIREHYFDLLIANNVTTDYCLQCYNNNEKPFATFSEYYDYYDPVIKALENINMEVVKLCISNSVILEPDILCGYLIMAYTRRRSASSKDEEEARNLYAYLISLKPIYHEWDQPSNQFAGTKCPFLPAAEKISDQALPNYSRDVTGHIGFRKRILLSNVYRFREFPYITSTEEFASVKLEQLCRTTIRQQLRETTLQDNLQNFRRRILELPLPKPLTDFLLFKD